MSYELEYTKEETRASEAQIKEVSEDTFYRYIFEMGEVPDELEVKVEDEYFDINVDDVFTKNEQRLLKNIIENDDCFDVSFDAFVQKVKEIFTGFNSAILGGVK
jgi:hypothetical protein